jgi:hypothetical protein
MHRADGELERWQMLGAPIDAEDLASDGELESGHAVIHNHGH